MRRPSSCTCNAGSTTRYADASNTSVHQPLASHLSPNLCSWLFVWQAFLMAKVLEGQAVSALTTAPLARAEEKGASLPFAERGSAGMPVLAEEKRLVSGLTASGGTQRQPALNRLSSKLDSDDGERPASPEGPAPATSGSRQWLEVVSRVVAEQRFAAGEAVQAACCHLAVGDYPRAIQVRPPSL